MGLEYKPETIGSMRARLDAALAPITPVRLIMAEGVEGPGHKREHVFDFEDGHRLLISRDRLDNKIVWHFSGSNEQLTKQQVEAKTIWYVRILLRNRKPPSKKAHMRWTHTQRAGHVCHIFYDEKQPTGDKKTNAKSSRPSP